MEQFKDYAYYYNLIYEDKDYKKEAEIIDKLIKIYGKNINKVLNLGCGTGKHDIELEKIGYDMMGIDLSEEMIDIAKKNQKETLKFENEDVRKYRDGKKYDAVISLFHVMSYQNTNEDVSLTLRTANEELKEDSIFIFDAWYGPGVLTDRPSIRVKRAESMNCELIRVAEPIMHANDNIVDVCYEVLIMNRISGITQKINEVHKMRYFFRPEIKYFLKQNGFQLIDCIDCNTLKEPDYNSWTVYFIAQKKED